MKNRKTKAKQVLKNSPSDIHIFPVKEPKQPGSLGFQLERKMKGKQRKAKEKTTKNRKNAPKVLKKCYSNIPIFPFKGSQGSQEPWVSNWKEKQTKNNGKQ